MIFWLLCGGPEVGSSKLQGYNAIDALEQHGNITSHVLYRPRRYSSNLRISLLGRLLVALFSRKGDLFILQKIHSRQLEQLVILLRKKACKVIFYDCDPPVKSGMAKCADQTVVPNDQLKQNYNQAGFSNVQVIPDFPTLTFSRHSNLAAEGKMGPGEQNNKPLTALWFGQMHREKIPEIEFIRNLFAKDELNKWQLIVLSNSGPCDLLWAEVEPYKVIKDADVIVIPSDRNQRNALKSSNRLLQGLAAGKPVLATPITAYVAESNSGAPVILCENEVDWIANLVRLEDLSTRDELGRAGLEFIEQHYSADRHAKIWTQIIEEWGIKTESSNWRLLILKKLLSLSSAVRTSNREDIDFQIRRSFKTGRALIVRLIILGRLLFSSMGVIKKRSV